MNNVTMIVQYEKDRYFQKLYDKLDDAGDELLRNIAVC